MIDLGALGIRLVVDGADATRQLNDFEDTAGGAEGGANRLNGALSNLAKGLSIGAIIKKVIGGLAACVKMSDELKRALNTLQAQTGATDKAMTGMEKSLKNIYANNYGESFEDIATAMSEVSNQTGLAGQALEGTTESAIALRDTFGYEVNESIRAVDMMMRQFGVTSDEAYSMIAQGAQNGLDKNGNLLDSINEYSVHFKQFGLNSEDMFNMFANGAKAGVFDIDKLGDAMKEFGIRSKDGSDATIGAYQQLGLNADELQQKFSNGGESAEDAFEDVMQALNNCDDEVTQNAIGVSLFGTMWEDMGADAVKALANTQGNISKTTESLESIKSIKYDDIGNALTGIGRQFELGIMLPIGEKLLPLLNDFANWISQNMPLVLDIVKVAMAGLAAAFVMVTGPVGLVVAGIAAVAAAGVGLYNAINDTVDPAMELLADKVSYAADGTMILEQAISDSTEAAVGSYMDLEKSATESLTKLYANTTTITEEQRLALEEQYKQMNDMVCAKMEERHTEEMKVLEQGFADSKTLSEEQETEIAARLNDKQWEEKAAVGAHYEEINAIVANAKAEERSLTLVEMQQIQAIQEEQKANALKVLSDSEVEARVILDRMKNYNGTISAEIAAKTIQDAETARAAVVAEAEKKCTDEISIAQRMKDELGIISEAEYSQMVTAAEKKKIDTVQKANEMKAETVEAMLAQNTELADAVDTSTGEILSKWDVFVNDTAAKWEEISAEVLAFGRQIKIDTVREFTELGEDIVNKLEMAKNFLKDIWEGIAQTFSSVGKSIKDNTVKIFTDLKTSTVNKFTEMKTALSTKIEEIKTAITGKFTEIVTAAKKLPKDMKQVGTDMIQGLIDGFKAKVQQAVDEVKLLCDKVVSSAKSVFDINSPSKVFYEIGSYVSEGLGNGINEGGGTAVGAMESLASKILSTGDALSTGIIAKDSETGAIIYDNIYTNTMKKIDLYYQDRDKRIALMNEGTEENIKSVEREVKETEKASTLKIKLYQQEYKAKIQLLSDEANEATRALQAELDAIDAIEEQKQRQSESIEYELKMQELYNKLHIADAKDKDGILADIQKTEAARQKVLDKQAINDQKAAIRERMATVKEEAEAKKKTLQEELEAKEYQLEQQRTTEITHMNAIISLMEAQVVKRKELEKIETEIAKNEEQQRGENLKEAKQAELELERQRLNAEKLLLEESLTQAEALLKQKVGSAEKAEQDITKAVLTETKKRSQAQDLFPAPDGKVYGSNKSNGNPNTVTEEQTEFAKEQWDIQTEYRQKKEQVQTITFQKLLKAQTDYFLQQFKAQTDYFLLQQKERAAAFNAALNAAVTAFQGAAQNIQSIAYTCGQQIYEGIASTEGDINDYISRMVEKIRDSLESASRSAGGDFEDSDYDGSHRNGLSYVPYDDYRAILHKGEAVLTANENRQYNNSETFVKQSGNVTVNQYISSPVSDARQLERQAKRQFKKISLEV